MELVRYFNRKGSEIRQAVNFSGLFNLFRFRILNSTGKYLIHLVQPGGSILIPIKIIKRALQVSSMEEWPDKSIVPQATDGNSIILIGVEPVHATT